jgi:hypothetical protein
MATLVRTIFDAAYGKNAKNVPDYIATEATELLSALQRELQKLFSLGAEVNPAFFGESAVVAFSAPGWARPDDAESIFRIENGSAAEVVEVPLDDRAAEIGKPAVYAWGQVFRGAGNALDPAAGNLTFYYSKVPRTLTALTGDPDGTLDPLWPEQYNELLILAVAIYLAEKEDRDAEVARLSAQYAAWLELFKAFLSHETTTLRRRMAGNSFSQKGRKP